MKLKDVLNEEPSPSSVQKHVQKKTDEITKLLKTVDFKKLEKRLNQNAQDIETGVPQYLGTLNKLRSALELMKDLYS